MLVRYGKHGKCEIWAKWVVSERRQDLVARVDSRHDLCHLAPEDGIVGRVGLEQPFEEVPRALGVVGRVREAQLARPHLVEVPLDKALVGGVDSLERLDPLLV